MTAELIHRWAEGWTVSRGTAAPVATRWGLRIEVGAENQLRRHVLLDPREQGVRELVASIAEPLTWIKTHVEPAELGPWLPAGWAEGDPGWLMAIDVAPAEVTVPDKYRLTSESKDGVTYVRILTSDGDLAARGQYGYVGDYGTVDKISTEPAHRRRGLGSVVMDALANAAYGLGASTSVLGATVEGRALYESLGWKVHAPLAGFIFNG
ncbi:GNAT family N-acetyltransferase [Catenulispora pinisilvae]|uniref:GNAT family N-acetyltransferase n=1 Tax=Catenulispora pinisilvae TaxID=2705253 RepID=UPI001891959E|nr:GNAT family N-acetyltransferase [Catenulispora pinisilvae]